MFAFFEQIRPRYVVLAAAKVGGILPGSTNPLARLVVEIAAALRSVAFEHVLHGRQDRAVAGKPA